MQQSSSDSLNGLRLCICTPDYVHLVKNGGIGTSFHHTASVLTGLGAEVTILYANRTPDMSGDDRSRIQSVVAAEGSVLEFLFPDTDQDSLEQFAPNDIYTVTSYLAYQWLRRRTFDVVLFADWRGVAYFSVHARKQGLAFANTQLWVQGHSTMLWHEVNNQNPTYSELDVRVYHYERKSIELADRLVTATEYLKVWKQKHAFRFPEHAHALPLIIDRSKLAGRKRETAGSTGQDAMPIDELVFFGRLEKRKGLHLFLQALQRLKRYHPELLEKPGLKVTFLGKMARIDGLNSAEYIDRGMARLDVPYTLNVSLSSDEAISYLGSRRALAVMPSLTDNSPLTVHECINAGIPFVACATGGIPEIVAAEDHAHTLTPPFGPPLAARLAAVLESGQRPARPAVDQDRDNIPRWAALLSEARAAVRSVPPLRTAAEPLVSVCVTHFERPAFLRKTLDGLAAQSYRNFEVIIVDNDSRTKAATAFLSELVTLYPGLNLQVHRLPDLYAGAARNFALSKAKAELLIFMDDDNFAHPEQITVFVRAIEASGFDALSSAVLAFPEDEDPAELRNFVHLYLPAGSGLALNLFGNAYGDANGIYRKSAVLAVGGFTEDRMSWEDYELYSRLEHEGFKVGMIPEPLVFLRHTVGGVSRVGSMLGNYYRALRPALDHLPWETYGDAILVALNGSLQRFDGVRFDAQAPEDDPRLFNNDAGPVTMSRLLVRRLVAADRPGEALAHLAALAGSSPAMAPLDYDLLFGRLKLEGPSVLDKASAVEGYAGGLARAYSRSLELRRGQPLVAFLTEVEGERPLFVDEVYLLGLAEVCSGEVMPGLNRWARMIDKEEQKYVEAAGDLRTAMASGHLDSGLGHFMRAGHAERRPFDYVPPLHQPFAEVTTLVPADLARTLDLTRQLATSDAALAVRGALLQVVTSGSAAAACFFARYVLTETEARYVRDHPDVARELSAGMMTSVWDHLERHGVKEGRTRLTSAIETDDICDQILARDSASIVRTAARPLRGSLIEGYIGGADR